ncbi:DUF350 domain-containing protein [Faecalibacter macacae]|uniref:DUF350 domain-containing protein n=1 Tax=Faecalibacter macacae TaxID=1859289 RepID=A0A3L9M0Q5_9FLAO|nr:DUF350 domain-containing protein [Faecalibacter macacae]RLZ06747.1 DUF350 domain-containing protein [Faecalibacter macacae]
MELELFYKGIIASVIYSIIGVTVLLVAYWIMERLTPEKSWKEIVENKNMALAIVFGAMILGISIIIAAAIHG